MGAFYLATALEYSKIDSRLVCASAVGVPVVRSLSASVAGPVAALVAAPVARPVAPPAAPLAAPEPPPGQTN